MRAGIPNTQWLDRLNVFNAYKERDKREENDLTNAFLVVLRYVPMAQAIFTDLIRQCYLKVAANDAVLPSLSENPVSDMQAQRGELLCDEGHLVSVLLTDAEWEQTRDIQGSRRTAVYDAQIRYEQGWLLIIENKPDHGAVWEEQLHPNVEGSTGLEIETRAAVVKWQTIVERLISALDSGLIVGAEAKLVEDFLDSIDAYFPSLFVYKTFASCRGRLFLLQNRCRHILQEIAVQTTRSVKWDRRHGIYYIDLSGAARRGAAQKAVLSASPRGNGDWDVTLEMYPADTNAQADEFYNLLDIQKLLDLQSRKWKVEANVHFSYIRTGLVRVRCPALSLHDYLKGWKERKWKRGRYPLDEDRDLSGLVAYLQQSQLVSSDAVDELRGDLKGKFLDTKRRHLDICPGVSVVYAWSGKEASDADTEGDFVGEVKRRIEEALAAWGQSL